MKFFLAAAIMAIMLGCSSSPPCGPVAPPDAGCGQTFDVEYDPSTQNGCVFNGGSGTTDTCASLCGATATCVLVTFTSVECTTKCSH